jgi:hypothetical protein
MITRDVRWGKSYGDYVNLKNKKILDDTELESSDEDEFITAKSEKDAITCDGKEPTQVGNCIKTRSKALMDNVEDSSSDNSESVEGSFLVVEDAEHEPSILKKPF